MMMGHEKTNHGRTFQPDGCDHLFDRLADAASVQTMPPASTHIGGLMEWTSSSCSELGRDAVAAARITEIGSTILPSSHRNSTLMLCSNIALPCMLGAPGVQ